MPIIARKRAQSESEKPVEFYNINPNDEERIAKVLDMIGSRKLVLDLGCGDGFIMGKIKDKGNQVFGIENEKGAVKKANRKRFKVWELSLQHNWADKIDMRFNVIFAGEIIEHIFDTDKFLQNCRKVLKNKGHLIITTPNIASLGRRVLLLLGKNPLIETTYRRTDSGHIRYFTFDSLADLLSENGFQIIEKYSSVVNFDNKGINFSKLLSKLFPSVSSTIIVKAIKI